MNFNEVRRVLGDEIYKLRSKKTKPDRLNAVANGCGKVLQSYRIQLDACKMAGVKPDAKLIGGAEQKKLPKKQ